MRNKLLCEKCGHDRFTPLDKPSKLVNTNPHTFITYYKCMECGHEVAFERQEVEEVDYFDDEEDYFDDEEDYFDADDRYFDDDSKFLHGDYDYCDDPSSEF